MTRRGPDTTTARASAVAAVLFALACQVSCQANEAGTAGESQQAAPASEVADDGAVAARLNGRDITTEELDDWIKDELFRKETGNHNPSELYSVRSDALRNLLERRAVEEEAESLNLSLEDLLEQETAKLGDVGDADIAEFYEQNQGRMGDNSLEQMSSRIREHLMQQRVGQAVAAVYDRADVEVLLEAPRVRVAAEGPSRGPEGAPITIIEFSDFQCPYCKRALPTLDQLLEKYPEKIRVVYRHLPLEGIHPRARPAAAAAVCAEAQGRFWEYHDLVFENNRALEDADLEGYAGQLGLDVESFKQCVADGSHRERIDADIAAATAVGITGTPAFVVNGIVMRGAKPLDEFAAIIEAELSKAGSGESPPAG